MAVIGAVVVLLGLGGGGWFIWHQYLQSCTVGAYGSDAQITMTGPNADAMCDRLISSSSHEGYSTSEDTSGTMMCKLTIDDTTVVVRDKGALHLVGTGLCETLPQFFAT